VKDDYVWVEVTDRGCEAPRRQGPEADSQRFEVVGLSDEIPESGGSRNGHIVAEPTALACEIYHGPLCSSELNATETACWRDVQNPHEHSMSEVSSVARAAPASKPL
jgi:hypothetical protein